MIAILLHVLLLLVLPPLLIGVINKTKAFFAGRVGAPFLQPYYDIVKLLGKGMVISSSTTWIFRAGPVVSVVAAVVAGLMIPLGNDQAVVSFTGDFLLFAYLFALSRFFTTSAALDTGSPFEGMGSAREVTFAVLTEPALFFAFLVLARLSGSLTLSGMLSIGVTPMYAVGNAALKLVGIRRRRPHRALPIVRPAELQPARGEPVYDDRQERHHQRDRDDDWHAVQPPDARPLLFVDATKLQRLGHDVPPRCITEIGLVGSAPVALSLYMRVMSTALVDSRTSTLPSKASTT